MPKFEKAFGAIPSPIDIRDYRGTCAATAADFPEEFELEMPEVKNQGSVGSCVAHSISTVVEYFSRLQGDDARPMSTGYIYGNRTNSSYKGSGMITREAIQVTATYGDVPNTLFPYNVEVPSAIELFEINRDSLFTKGIGNRITSYYRVQTENDIKASLTTNGPVVIVVDWYSDMTTVDGVLTTAFNKREGSHCMVIYGWNARGWKVQNSWGVYWGVKGRCIIPFEHPLVEAWGIIDEYSENQTTQKIKKLQEENERLQAQILELSNTVIDLDAQLSKILEENTNLTAENFFAIQQLNQQIADLTRELEECRQLVDVKTKEIEVLQKQLIEIQKPYDSKGGQVFAKIVNFFIMCAREIGKFFSKIFKKNK